MIKKMGYQWMLRQLMAQQEMFQTSDLVPLLAERGVTLSREQVYRLVTQPPQRLSMDTLVALCDILQCTPNDLIKPEVVNVQVRKTAEGTAGPTPHGPAPSAVRASWPGSPPTSTTSPTTCSTPSPRTEPSVVFARCSSPPAPCPGGTRTSPV
jgi:DNA-binding Xre family transcriptional regulator